MFASLSSFKIVHSTSYFTDASIDLFTKDNTKSEVEVHAPAIEEFSSTKSFDISNIFTTTSSPSTSSSTSASLDVNNIYPMLCSIDSSTEHLGLSFSFTDPRDPSTFEP